jgi:cysteine desulfurase
MFLLLGATCMAMQAETRAMIYLDANASETLRPQARAAVLAALDLVGNPASIHGAGRAAWACLESARKTVAARFGARPADLVFTSGGTEANALAISGLSGLGRTVMFGATEHDAVRACGIGRGGITVPVRPEGQVDLAALDALLRSHGPALVCLMLANNETGILHPIAEVAGLCRAHGALLHVDAVQAAGRLEFSIDSLGADSLAISAHKLGGPKGAGALILSPGAPPLAPVMAGGGQERGRRGGTPALPAIAGFAAAVEAAEGAAGLAGLRDRAEAAAVLAGGVVCGKGERLANTLCIARPGLRADTQVIALDLAGIAVSAGAACSSGKVARSHVLEAMALHDLADCAIRVSLPWNTQPADIEAFISAYQSRPGRQEAA